MGILDSFGGLVASLAGLSPEPGFVTLSAAIISAAAIIARASPLTGLAGE